MTEDDPFAAYGAERGKREKPVRVTGKAAPMVKKGLEKKQEDEARQMKRFNAMRRAELQLMIDGHRGQEILQLQTLLRSYIHDTGREVEVMTFLDRAGWFGTEPVASRLRILSMIGQAILRSRLRDGRPPFDDPIPLLDTGTPPAPEGLFEKAKERLSNDDKHGRDDQGNAGRQSQDLGTRSNKNSR